LKLGLSNFPTDYSIGPVALATAAEERGFDSLWITEHTHIPASRRTPWPAGGELPSIYWESYEPFTYLAMAAAATQRLKLGTGVCLVPEHHPISLAKRVASLDSLSGGRFLFGVGGGWNVEEMEHHGVRFEDRWKLLAESVEAMKLMWTEKEPEYHGRFVNFEKVWVEPKPKQTPHPPIFIGASSRWAIQRVVDFGDGWMPILGSCDLDERLQQLRELCDEAGRDVKDIDISIFAAGRVDQALLEELAAKGVNRVCLPLPSVGADKALGILDDWAGLVSWAAAA
jgi:probable F420-dependent oxidoreductase